jgi:adsorption protein B
MPFAEFLSRAAAELALFAGVGFLLFGVNDLLVDFLYFTRRAWRAVTVYTRHRPAYASYYVFNPDPGFIAILVPAWDESAVIASMLKATLNRLDYDDYRIFVGYYRNDPATAAAIASVADERIEAVEVAADGPTAKADCLNHLYDALIAFETDNGRPAKAVVLHDAEDVVHRYELRIFDGLIDRAAVVQLPVLPLIDPHSRWVSGHYCDEFAEAHIKELVVREAVGAAIPLAGVGCAIARKPLAQLAALQDGKPFAGNSMTEDYEVGLRIGGLGLKTMFVRISAQPSERGVVATRGHFPATLGSAVRHKARWLGGIALAGWDRLGWEGGLGERWMRMRDRRGPLAALLLVAAYSAALLWSQLWLAEALGAPIQARMDPALTRLLAVNGWLLAWRVLMRAYFTTSAYGLAQGLLSIPRLVVGNVIAMLAAARAVSLHLGGGAKRWDKTRHIFPAELPQ